MSSRQLRNEVAINARGGRSSGNVSGGNRLLSKLGMGGGGKSNSKGKPKSAAPSQSQQPRAPDFSREERHSATRALANLTVDAPAPAPAAPAPARGGADPARPTYGGRIESNRNGHARRPSASASQRSIPVAKAVPIVVGVEPDSRRPQAAGVREGNFRYQSQGSVRHQSQPSAGGLHDSLSTLRANNLAPQDVAADAAAKINASRSSSKRAGKARRRASMDSYFNPFDNKSVRSAPGVLPVPSSNTSVTSAPTVVNNRRQLNPRSFQALQGRSAAQQQGSPPRHSSASHVETRGRLSSRHRSSEDLTKKLHAAASADTLPMLNVEFVRELDDDTATITTLGEAGSTLGAASTLESGTVAGTIREKQREKVKQLQIPQGEVTIIFTDIQGSTSLWESNPTTMKEALDMHDKILRRCYTDHNGYEISTEGDAFHLAFQHPVDALSFALRVQVHLHRAKWPEGILQHPDAAEDYGAFRGFRVRIGMHHGPTTSHVHPTTGRTIFSGTAVKIAKAVEAMCHGGQILTTVETWRAVSGMAERYLGRPQVMDCGEHLLWEKSGPMGVGDDDGDGRISKRIVQLVPKDFAFDFFAARGRDDNGIQVKTAATVTGRLFPPLKTKEQLSSSFLDAPHANGRVTIAFVYTSKAMDTLPPDVKATNLAMLARLVRQQLMKCDPPGYECQEEGGSWMLAFDRMAQAVSFGLRLLELLPDADFEGDVGAYDRATMVKIGVHTGPFTSMGPHTITGHADYFGPIVNRAARVASACSPGQVCVGMPLRSGDVAIPPEFGPTVETKLVGIKKLKGLTVDMALFLCLKAART